MLIAMFRLNAIVVGKNVEGVSHEESLLSPPGGGNSANWVLGHITATRNAVLRLAGEQEVLPEPEARRYARGSLPIREGSEGLPFERLVREYRLSEERLAAALERMTVEDLARKGFEGGIGGESVGEQLAGFAFHEAYHAGQLGLHRRMHGREGAIR
jgi:hypothetical protein